MNIIDKLSANPLLRRVLGLAAVVVGVILVFVPEFVGEVLHRQASTIGETINLRSTWGGGLMGIGIAIFSGRFSPRLIMVASFTFWIMMAVVAVRVLGFFLDGAPDFWQWFNLVAELAIAVLAIAYIWWQKSIKQA